MHITKIVRFHFIAAESLLFIEGSFLLQCCLLKGLPELPGPRSWSLHGAYSLMFSADAMRGVRLSSDSLHSLVCKVLGSRLLALVLRDCILACFGGFDFTTEMPPQTEFILERSPLDLHKDITPWIFTKTLPTRLGSFDLGEGLMVTVRFPGLLPVPYISKMSAGLGYVFLPNSSSTPL